MLPTVFALCVSALPMQFQHGLSRQHNCDHNSGPFRTYEDCRRAGDKELGHLRAIAGDGMGQYYCLSVPSEE